MPRFHPHLLVLALVLGACLAPVHPARAEEPAGEGIAWVRSLPEGLAHARDAGTVVFLYYGRERPPCAPCKQLEREVFARPEAAVLGTRYVAVRILGGDDATETSRRLAKRYGVTGTPTMLVVAPDGGLLQRHVPRDLEGILAALAKATKDEAAFQTRRKALVDSSEPDAIRTLAGLHAARRDWPAARSGYAALTATGKNTAEDDEALVAVLHGMQDTDGEAELLRRMIQTYAAHPHRVRWQVRLVGVEALGSSADERDRLRGLLAETADPAAQAAIRLRLGAVLHKRRELKAARAAWHWILTKTPTAPEAPEALYQMAAATVSRGYGLGDLATLREGRALLKTLLEKHPDHARSAEARSMRVRVDRVIEQLETKARDD